LPVNHRVGLDAGTEKGGAVKEQSQIDAMREAIRGDIERSRARREPDEVGEPEPAPIEIRARPDESAPFSMRRPEPVPVEEPAAASPVAEPEAEPEPAVELRRGVLSRLFRRR
jgi:hypothetical protein